MPKKPVWRAVKLYIFEHALITWVEARKKLNLELRGLSTDYMTFFFFLSLWGHRDCWGSCFSVGFFLFSLSFTEASVPKAAQKCCKPKHWGFRKALTHAFLFETTYLSSGAFQRKEVFDIKVQRRALNSIALASKMIALKDITNEPCSPLCCERQSMACHSSPALNDSHVLSEHRLVCKGQRRKT